MAVPQALATSAGAEVQPAMRAVVSAHCGCAGLPSGLKLMTL